MFRSAYSAIKRIRHQPERFDGHCRVNDRAAAVVVKKTGISRKVVQLSRNGLRWVALSPDGNWVATGNWFGDGDVTMWDARTGKLVRNLKVPGNATPAFSPDSRWIVTNALTLCDSGRWNSRLRHTLPSDVVVPSPVKFTGDSRIAAIGRRGIGLHLFDLRTGKVLAMLMTNQRRPHFESMYFQFGRRSIVAGRGDAGVCIWDLHTIRRRFKAMRLDWEALPYPISLAFLETGRPLKMTIIPARRGKSD